MKIVDILERTASIASPIRNAYIDFSKMTVSVAAFFGSIRQSSPWLGTAETNRVLIGSVSVSTTSSASDGPRLATVRV